MIDLDAEMRFWLDTLNLEACGWKVTWGWVDSIPLNDGRSAFGLNTLDADARTSNIKIKKPVSDVDYREFVDTCAHEMSHNFGAEIERRLLEAQSEQERTNAHEYIAETLAPALTRIKNTPREKAFAKAIKSLSRKTEAFAKVANQLPARAKEETNMPEDIASLEKAMIEARLAGDSAKVQELFDKWLAAKVTAQSGDAVPPSAAPLAAAPPVPGTDKPEDKPTPPAAKPMEDTGYMKAFEVLVDAREDLKPRRTDVLGYLKKHHKTVEGAAEYLKTIPVAKAQQEPKAPAAKPIDDNAPRGGTQPGGVQLLAKADERAKVGALMGLPINSGQGPRIITKKNGDETYKVFVSGNLTPTQWRAKKAAGWDPSKEFPMPGQEAS